MKLLAFTLALLGVPSLLTAGDSSEAQLITLKDKSVIRAQVTEMSGGFYLVKSPVLGEMKIPTGEVVSIHNERTAAQSADAPAAPSKSGATPAQPTSSSLESLRSTLSSKVQNFVSNREGMNAVMDFSRSPDVKAVMNDPQVMKAIQAGDYNALMQSPAMQNLLDNPQTKTLIQSVLHSTPQNTDSPGEPPAAAK